MGGAPVQSGSAIRAGGHGPLAAIAGSDPSSDDFSVANGRNAAQPPVFAAELRRALVASQISHRRQRRLILSQAVDAGEA
jgi:hypothetical protein